MIHIPKELAYKTAPPSPPPLSAIRYIVTFSLVRLNSTSHSCTFCTDFIQANDIFFMVEWSWRYFFSFLATINSTRKLWIGLWNGIWIITKRNKMKTTTASKRLEKKNALEGIVKCNLTVETMALQCGYNTVACTCWKLKSQKWAIDTQAP